MSTDNNKPIVKKAQELFKEYGHDIKTGHIYEVFSKLSGEKSWNSASAKNISFGEKILSAFKSTPLISKEIIWDKYKKMYLDHWNTYKDSGSGRFILGVLRDNENQRLLLKDMTLEPNALFVGSMGSGKSIAMSSTLFSYFFQNPGKTLLFIVDPLKGANDYQALFGFPKVYPVLSSESGILKTIDLLYEEAMARKEVFAKYKAESIVEYERLSGKEMDRCILAMEEFHYIPSRILNFEKDFKVEGTIAHKFHQLMRIGRSYGIWIFAAAQRSTKSDIPAQMLPNFTNKQAFRMSSGEADYTMGDTQAALISPREKGLCATDYGMVQFPYFTIAEQNILLKDTPKFDKFNCSLLTPELIKDGLEDKGEKIFENKSIKSLIKSINTSNKDSVIKFFHKKNGDKILQELDSRTDPFGACLVVENDGKKTVVAIKNQAQIKHVIHMKEAMQKYECSNCILYSLEEVVPLETQTFAYEKGVEIVDREDLQRISNILSID